MVYRIDNRRKSHRGRYTILGICLGIFIAIGGLYVYENYKQPITNDFQVVKNKVDLLTQTPSPIISNNQVDTTYTNQKPKSDSINTIELEKQIHNEINNIREQNGLRSLVLDEKLSEMAREHSKDMIINNYFDHTSPYGITLQNRLISAQIPCFAGGENIEENYLSEPDLLNSIIATWMDSSGHKDNILTPFYSNEGIGVYSDGDRLLITEDFC